MVSAKVAFYRLELISLSAEPIAWSGPIGAFPMRCIWPSVFMPLLTVVARASAGEVDGATVPAGAAGGALGAAPGSAVGGGEGDMMGAGLGQGGQPLPAAGLSCEEKFAVVSQSSQS